MGNSLIGSRSQFRRHREDAAVQGNPIIRCEYVGEPVQQRGDSVSKHIRRPRDLNRLSPEDTSRNFAFSVRHKENRHRDESQSQIDAITAAPESVSTLSTEQQNPIPLITVTRYGDHDRELASKAEECELSTLTASQPCPSRDQPGLTGVPRHRPFQRVPQNSPYRIMPRAPRRAISGSPGNKRSADSKPGNSHRVPRTDRGTQKLRQQPVNNQVPVGQETKMSQSAQCKMIRRQYEALAGPTACTRSSSAAPLARVSTPLTSRRRSSSRDFIKRAPRLPQSKLEYTFYIRDTDEQRKPFDDNTADAIARGCECSIELIALGKGCPPVFHKGLQVCPVTITTSNMANLRKCLARLDAYYPEFNAKAFLPH
ncbi:unnamed protein product [Mesocestoides corti]|uniref:Ras-associating domain-containing protein n=1 Tax=Mesocestoides corti TaxID=53468 RepID=A0A0R3U3L1_MESCO|nr:unnamed protein product [Mesocestoides corti]